MADYIYLLEHRLSVPQQTALRAVRDVARSEALTVFLVGGAVRDLTSGSPVRDLDVVVQGNALKLRKKLELGGALISGEAVAGQSLFVRFPGGARVEVGSTLSVTYPKPGKPVMKPANLLDDLRRRDFTANAMALSLNEGSYGLLMDPLNGVADIENRQLRLVSNYGFIEDPIRMVRASRFMARLGWTMDDKTQARYDTGKQENYIATLSDFHRGYETEEIFHEEDPLRILRKLEEEGWMKSLFPALAVAKANATELERLREVQTQLQMRGIHPEAAAANFPLLTAKLSAAEVAELKRSFVRPGFVAEVDGLDAAAKELAAMLVGKGAATPSQSWKLIDAARPEALLWVAYTSKNANIQAKLKSFYTEWPQARTKIPYTLMQEMRIVPDLPGYDELVEKLFFHLMDGALGTVEEMKAFLQTYSPPAPPPPIHLRRPRAPKKDAKSSKSRKKATPIIDPDASSESDADSGSHDGISVDTADHAAGAVPQVKAVVPSDEPRVEPAKPASGPKPAILKSTDAAREPVAKPAAAQPVVAVRGPAPAPLKVVAPKLVPSPPKAPVKAAPVPVPSLVKKLAPVAAAAHAPVKKAAPAVAKKAAASAKKTAPAKTAPNKAAPIKLAAKKAAPSKPVPAQKPQPAKKSR